MVLCETSVRERAYYIWEGEGRIFGRAEAHWLQAEAELRQVALAESARITAPAEPAKVAKPRATRAKPAVKAPTEVLAGVAKAAKAPSKAAAASAEKPAVKAAKAAPKSDAKSKPAAGRAKSRVSAESAVLH